LYYDAVRSQGFLHTKSASSYYFTFGPLTAIQEREMAFMLLFWISLSWSSAMTTQEARNDELFWSYNKSPPVPESREQDSHVCGTELIIH
jgi:hypothetical protein